mmetsp:Transcript_41220/g.129513  ORF Transcript_41220/g.129513 Transcript_41220/m.129513 type:complete len:85 (+) Transcript_41220:387-641(+)
MLLHLVQHHQQYLTVNEVFTWMVKQERGVGQQMSARNYGRMCIQSLDMRSCRIAHLQQLQTGPPPILPGSRQHGRKVNGKVNFT